MTTAFVHASRARATAAPMTADASFLPRSVPSASKRLQPSQQPAGGLAWGAGINSRGMRPSQVAVVRSGGFAAIPPAGSALGGLAVGGRASRSGSRREGQSAAGLRIQRCGIGSSCDCSPRDKLAGIEDDLHRVTAAGGTPLPATARQRMESAFSANFAGVRVHTGSAAHTAALALGARALTAGTNILFQAGEYQPGTPGGDRLLAHELAHVVQQAHSLPQAILDTGATDHLERAAGLAAAHASPAAEREAHGAAMIAAMGRPVPVLSRQPSAIARQNDPDAEVAGAGGHTVDINSEAYLRGYNDGRAGNPAAPGPLSPDAMDDYNEGYQNGATEAQNAQASLPPVSAPPVASAGPAPPPPSVFFCSKNVAFGRKHAFFRVGGAGPGNQTYELEHDEYGDHCPCGIQGIPTENYPEDRDSTDATCIPAPAISATCLAQKWDAYPHGNYCAWGPNSNTYARVTAEACGGAGLRPPGTLPGFTDPPPAAGTANPALDARAQVLGCSPAIDCDDTYCHQWPTGF